MVFNPEIHRRRSVRLRGFDYGNAGAYFITVCTYDRDFLFGDVVDGNMVLNDFGAVVEDEWRRTEHLRLNVVLDEFIIMPNHFHGILFIKAVGAHCMRPDTVNHSNTNGASVGTQTGRTSVRPYGGNRGRWGRLLRGSNPSSPNASTSFAIRRGLRYGNGIIMNGLSAQTRN